jgi:hypothetical protein
MDGHELPVGTEDPGVKENSPMTEEEQVEMIASEFIDELWQIGVFELIPADDCKLLANAPLFAVAKAGQPGDSGESLAT